MNLFNISIDIIGNSSIFRIIKVYTLFIHLSILLSKKILNFQTLLGGMAVFAFPPAHCLDRFSSQAVTPARRIMFMFKRRFIITLICRLGPSPGSLSIIIAAHLVHLVQLLKNYQFFYPLYFYPCAFSSLSAYKSPHQ